jgi:hypothetical protein
MVPLSARSWGPESACNQERARHIPADNCRATSLHKESRKMPSNILDVALSATLIVSAAFNVLQMREINKLRSPHANPSTTILTGIPAKTLSGNPARIEALGDGKPTLLYVFSPQCAWCTRNYESVKLLALRAKSNYRVVALSLNDHGLREALGSSPLPFEVYSNPSADAVATYDLSATPTTLVFSPDGQILRAWRGAYAGRVRSEIQRYFGLTLPDIPLSQ